jgi:hypothetical protein
MILKLAVDLDDRAASAGNRAADEDLAGFRLDRDYGQTFGGDAITAHASCHALVLGNTSAIASSAAERTRLALRVLLAVGARTAVESVSLDHALEALAFGCSGDCHDIACGKAGEIHRVADFESRLAFDAELAEVCVRATFHLAGQRLVDVLGCAGTEAELYCRVSVSCGILDLGDDHWADLDYRHGMNQTLLIEDLRHVLLCSENEFH